MKEPLGGMTVNERLYATNLIDAWDDALSRKDRITMIEILEKVELGADATPVADEMLRRKWGA